MSKNNYFSLRKLFNKICLFFEGPEYSAFPHSKEVEYKIIGDFIRTYKHNKVNDKFHLIIYNDYSFDVMVNEMKENRYGDYYNESRCIAYWSDRNKTLYYKDEFLDIVDFKFN